MFSSSWIPNTSVRYKTAVSDFLPVTYRVTERNIRYAHGLDGAFPPHSLSSCSTSFPTGFPECAMAETSATGQWVMASAETAPARASKYVWRNMADRDEAIAR